MSAVPMPQREAGEPISRERYEAYEKGKQAWIDAQIAAGHAATSFEYDKAIRAIACECGI